VHVMTLWKTLASSPYFQCASCCQQGKGPILLAPEKSLGCQQVDVHNGCKLDVYVCIVVGIGS